MTIPAPGLVAELLAAAGIDGAWRVEPIGDAGRINRHALVSLDDGRRFVVREYGWPFGEPVAIDRLQKERWLHALLAEAGVPVPRILAMARTSEGEALLMERIGGDLLGEVCAREPEADLGPAWRAAGATLRRVHAIPPPARTPGWLTHEGVLPYETGSWAGWIRTQAVSWAIAVRRAAPDVPVDVNACGGFLSKAAQLLEARPLALIHGDACAWNAVVTPHRGAWRFAAWLDWEFAQIGDPAWDVVWMSLCRHQDIDPIPNAFFEGYGERVPQAIAGIYELIFHLWRAGEPLARSWNLAFVAAADRYLSNLPAHLSRLEGLVQRALD